MVSARPILPPHDSCGLALVADRRGRASRDVVERALAALPRLAARGAADVQERPGTGAVCGAGILTAVPWDVVGPELPAALRDPASHRIAAMFVLDRSQADRALVAARSALGRLGWHVMAWRDVPMHPAALAPDRRAMAPRMVQCFARASRYRQKRTPYRTRLAIEARWRRLGLTGCAVASLSESTMVYKGLVDPAALPSLFPDLADGRFTSAFALLHHSAGNAAMRWDLVQPFHAIALDGAIDTIAGNRMWMNVRISDAGIRDEADLPKAGGSDAQTLDAAVQWLREVGLSTPHALSRLLPPAWECEDDAPPEVRAFHRHESCFAEPWNGPAAIGFADGRHIGALADRSDSRPLYVVETDDHVWVGPEADAFDTPGQTVTHGQLNPGELLVIDVAEGTVMKGAAVWSDIASRKSYADLVNRYIRRIGEAAVAAVPVTPHYRATSLRTLLGRRGQWTPHGLAPVLLELDSPVLLNPELEAVVAQSEVRAAVLPIGCGADEALPMALATLQTRAAALAANGTRILVLSDRQLEPGMSPIASEVATAAVDAVLRSARLRLRASIVVDAADIRDAHDAAMLASVGASAIVPHRLYAGADMSDESRAADRRRALEDGLREILIATGAYSFEAYCGARMNVPATAPAAA